MRFRPSRSLILAQSAAMLAVMLIGVNAFARPVDTVGGPGSDTQTISHCGAIPVARMVYTDAPRNVKIIQRKLTELGYYHGALDGVNSRITKQAVLAFQRDYGLRPDAIVGQETVRTLVFFAHPLANVRSCRHEWRQASR
jgi:hypothetical protein